MWRSHRPRSRSGGRTATAHGWIGRPDSRATISAPGFARRYGPNGPSGTHAQRGALRGRGGRARASGEPPPTARPRPAAATEPRVEGRQHGVHHLAAERLRAEADVIPVAPQPERRDRGGQVVLVPEGEDDLLLVDGRPVDAAGGGDEAHVQRQGVPEQPRQPSVPRAASSEVALACRSRDLVEDRLDLLGPVAVADEERVGRVDDDQVLEPDGHDEPIAAMHEDAVRVAVQVIAGGDQVGARWRPIAPRAAPTRNRCRTSRRSAERPPSGPRPPPARRSQRRS